MSSPSVTDWLSVILSSAAIIIGLVVSVVVWKQSRRFHLDNQTHGRATYARDRYDDLLGLCTEILDHARLIQVATSARWKHLMGEDQVPISPSDDEGRGQVSEHLALLENRADRLVHSRTLLPDAPDGASGKALEAAIARMRYEAAWMVGDAHNTAICFFAGPEYNPVEGGTRAEINDLLVEGSMQNLSARLLFGETNVPTYREPGSPWPHAVKERLRVLASDNDVTVKVREEPMSEHSNRMLYETIDRFSDALADAINAAEAMRRAHPA